MAFSSRFAHARKCFHTAKSNIVKTRLHVRACLRLQLRKFAKSVRSASLRNPFVASRKKTSRSRTLVFSRVPERKNRISSGKCQDILFGIQCSRSRNSSLFEPLSRKIYVSFFFRKEKSVFHYECAPNRIRIDKDFLEISSSGLSIIDQKSMSNLWEF